MFPLYNNNLKESPMKRIHMFQDAAGNTVVFRPVQRVPGFTHRVIVNQVATGWLASGFKPNAKHAVYFLTQAQGATP
jgi:hypothetical protein